MSDVYDLEKGQDFKRLPEISQIEVCSACNLQCPMCLRTTHLGRKPGLVEMELIKLMHERGDFEGTVYTELQMAGEPTLHPYLGEIIRYLKNKVGVLVGLSTHGLQIEKNHTTVAPALMLLDALTISVDSVDPETYHKMRYPAHIEELYKNLDFFFGLCESLEGVAELPMIELQLVKTSLAEKSGDVEALQQVMEEKGWDKYAVVRTIYDCFEGMQDRVQVKQKRELCLNPWTSVSVAHNGDVVSCCLIFTPNDKEINYYGNLYNKSLQEIWETQIVKDMRTMQLDHAAGTLSEMSHQCAKCTVRSPAMIHTQIVSRLVKIRGIQ